MINSLNVTEKLSTSHGLNVGTVVSIREDVAYFCATEHLTYFPSHCFGVNLKSNLVTFMQTFQRNYSEIIAITNQANLLISSSNSGTSRLTSAFDILSAKLIWSMDAGQGGDFVSVDNNGSIFAVSCIYNGLYIVENGVFIANFTVPNLMCPTSYQNPLIASDGSIYIAIPGGRVAPAYITKFN